MAAPVVDAVTTGYGDYTQDIEVSVPGTSPATGDVFFAWLSAADGFDAGLPDISTPGFTDVSGVLTSYLTRIENQLVIRVSDGTETGTFNFGSPTTSKKHECQCGLITGAGSSWQDDEAHTAFQSTTDTIIAPDVTSGGADRLDLRFFGWDGSRSVSTPPSGYNQEALTEDGQTGSAVYSDTVGSGAAGTQSLVISVADQWNAASLLVAPVSGGSVLSPAALDQLVALGSPTLRQAHAFSPAALDQLVTLDATLVNQAYVLTAADLDQLVALDTTTFSDGFPRVLSVTETAFPFASTDHSADVDADVVAGELLLAFFAIADGVSINTPSGWTSLTGVIAGTGIAIKAFAKVSDGTETTVNATTSGSETGCAQVYRIDQWYGALAGVEKSLSGYATGTSALPNGHFLAPSWGNAKNLWIVFAGAGNNDATLVTPPSGFSTGVDTVTGAGAGSSASIFTPYRKYEGTTLDPLPMQISASEDWGALTIAVRPVASTAIAVTSLTQLVVLDAGAVNQEHVATPAALTQLVSLDGGVVAQDHVLGPVALDQLVTLGVTGVAQVYSVAPDALDQLVTLGTTDLSVEYLLAAANLTQAVTLGTTLIEQAYAIVTANLTQAVTLDGTVLTLPGVIVPADLTQAVALQAVAVVQLQQLTTDGLTQLVTFEATAIGQEHALTAVDLAQTTVLDATALAQLSVLAPLSLAQLSTLDPAGALGIVHRFAPTDLDQLVVVDGTAVAQAHVLTAADLAAVVTLDVGGVIVPASVLAPAARSLVVYGEDRTLAVAAERRLLLVNSENRTLEVDP